METILCNKSSSLPTFEKNDEDQEMAKQTITSITENLPPDKVWVASHFCHYQNFWYNTPILKEVIHLQQHFKPKYPFTLLCTIPKAGTTWLKSLCFAIANREKFRNSRHPLLTTSPHECVPFMEMNTDYSNTYSNHDFPIVATHIPYTSLPKTIMDSDSRIIYMARDPKDVFVSLWHFMTNFTPKDLTPLSLEEAFMLFSEGVSPYGPFWDHVIGYWKASLDFPEKVFFLKYENMKEAPLLWVRKLAEFLGLPFSPKEEQDGVVEGIVKLCSYDNLSNLEVNKSGRQSIVMEMMIENSMYFRRGMIGDWKNYLTSEMAKCLDQIMEQKFKGTNLSLSSL